MNQPHPPRRLLRDHIRDVVMERILSGDYPPGERLRELHLAQEFGSSQGPVREALRELEAMQYVESRPNRGTRVRDVPDEEMRDAYRVRAALERAAAEAASRSSANDWDALDILATEIETAAERHDVADYARLDDAFHRGIVERSGNGILLRHWEMLLVATRVRAVLRSGDIDMRATAREHRPLIQALRAGDAALAGRLAFEHVRGKSS